MRIEEFGGLAAGALASTTLPGMPGRLGKYLVPGIYMVLVHVLYCMIQIPTCAISRKGSTYEKADGNK